MELGGSETEGVKFLHKCPLYFPIKKSDQNLTFQNREKQPPYLMKPGQFTSHSDSYRTMETGSLGVLSPGFSLQRNQYGQSELSVLMCEAATDSLASLLAGEYVLSLLLFLGPQTNVSGHKCP